MHKDLIQQKEELLKESKAKGATMDSVKTQIDGLMKACVSYAIVISIHVLTIQQHALEVQKKVTELVQPTSAGTANATPAPA